MQVFDSHEILIVSCQNISMDNPGHLYIGMLPFLLIKLILITQNYAIQFSRFMVKLSKNFDYYNKGKLYTQ